MNSPAGATLTRCITVLGVMMLSACPSPGEPTCECDAAMQPWSGPADALTQPDSVLAVEPIPLEVPLLTGYSANRQAFGQDGAWFGAAAQVGDVDGDRRDDVIIAHGIDWWPQYLTVYTHRPGPETERSFFTCPPWVSADQGYFNDLELVDLSDDGRVDLIASTIRGSPFGPRVSGSGFNLYRGIDPQTCALAGRECGSPMHTMCEARNAPRVLLDPHSSELVVGLPDLIVPKFEVADLDLDGDQDLIVAAARGSVPMCPGAPQPTQREYPICTPPEPSQEDELPEAPLARIMAWTRTNKTITTTSSAFIIENRGSRAEPQFMPCAAWSPGAGREAWDVNVADYDLDGWPDLAFAYSCSPVEIYFGGPTDHVFAPSPGECLDAWPEGTQGGEIWCTEASNQFTLALDTTRVGDSVLMAQTRMCYPGHSPETCQGAPELIVRQFPPKATTSLSIYFFDEQMPLRPRFFDLADDPVEDLIEPAIIVGVMHKGSLRGHPPLVFPIIGTPTDPLAVLGSRMIAVDREFLAMDIQVGDLQSTADEQLQQPRALQFDGVGPVVSLPLLEAAGLLRVRSQDHGEIVACHEHSGSHCYDFDREHGRVLVYEREADGRYSAADGLAVVIEYAPRARHDLLIVDGHPAGWSELLWDLDEDSQ
jgi:hypothetical protein